MTNKRINQLTALLLLFFVVASCKEEDKKAPDPVTTYTVSTLAGSTRGFTDGLGTQAKFNEITGLTIDAGGNLYVTDGANNCIRKVSPAGQVTTFAGNGSAGYDDGTGTAARFIWPGAITIDPAGNLFITSAHRIRKITPAGEVTTIAGDQSGYADGTGSNARFSTPNGITIDSKGNLFVADQFNNLIRKVTQAGEVTTFAGKGEFGFAEGTGREAMFYYPGEITIDANDNLYVADLGNHSIRKITPAGVVTTFAGKGGTADYSDGTGNNARFFDPEGICIDSKGNFYVSEHKNPRIRIITATAEVTTLAGSGVAGSIEGVGINATFEKPVAVVADTKGNIYVADTYRIRKITVSQN